MGFKTDPGAILRATQALDLGLDPAAMESARNHVNDLVEAGDPDAIREVKTIPVVGILTRTYGTRGTWRTEENYRACREALGERSWATAHGGEW